MTALERVAQAMERAAPLVKGAALAQEYSEARAILAESIKLEKMGAAGYVESLRAGAVGILAAVALTLGGCTYGPAVSVPQPDYFSGLFIPPPAAVIVAPAYPPPPPPMYPPGNVYRRSR